MRPCLPGNTRHLPATGAADGDWRHFGNDQAGTHFSPLAQIDASPLKIDDHLYICTPFNEILSLEPESGKLRWKYQAPRSNAGIAVVRCLRS